MEVRGKRGTEVGRWVGFVTAVWVQCISGNNYTFSNYSGALKSLMGLTQLELNNLSLAKDVGKAFGLLAGLASDRLSTPLILLIGSLEGLIGYGAQWLVVRRSIPPLPYWQMGLLLCLGGNSTTWMNTAVLVICMRNFRRSQGPVSGILKGYVGLSTAIFTELFSALFGNDPAAFLLMLAVVPATVCIAAMFFLRESPAGAAAAEDETATKYFGAINAMAVVIAVCLLAYDLTGDHGAAVSRAFVAVLLVLLAAPAAVPMHAAFKARSKSPDVESEIKQPLLVEEVKVEPAAVAPPDVAEEKGEGKRGPAIGEDHTIWEAAKTVDFWILFLSFLCGVGTGLTVMNNMGQMGLAMGYRDVSIFVSMISIWGFFGRIGSGSISEYFLKKTATPRPLWNAASQVLMAAGYVVMALALPGFLYIGSIVVGICYGVRIAITVPTASELFGLKYYGLIYNMLILNLPLGSFLFSGLLAGLLYDSQATNTAGGGNMCVGAHCYRLVFLIMAFACLIGFGLDVLLAFRTRKVYLEIHDGKKSRKTGSWATTSKS
ncbi:protein NUCLEAR FUSION DEFECTIVE 4-like [Phoenix dactylifera]|uniref:Protein NUCLEAR FUSION DEFECTIVE 4-like n=1 Tax=Phoenix dactylifera TaxID=42345 RepID=A0A8B8ZKV1_PHODC|nr:protein NUCLEAR FUSION DEFECTIVE 4-like [Phoenix dactylifera]